MWKFKGALLYKLSICCNIMINRGLTIKNSGFKVENHSCVIYCVLASIVLLIMGLLRYLGSITHIICASAAVFFKENKC